MLFAIRCIRWVTLRAWETLHINTVPLLLKLVHLSTNDQISGLQSTFAELPASKDNNVIVPSWSSSASAFSQSFPASRPLCLAFYLVLSFTIYACILAARENFSFSWTRILAGSKSLLIVLGNTVPGWVF